MLLRPRRHDTQYNDIQHNDTHKRHFAWHNFAIFCHYAERRVLFIFTLNVTVLNVVAPHCADSKAPKPFKNFETHFFKLTTLGHFQGNRKKRWRCWRRGRARSPGPWGRPRWGRCRTWRSRLGRRTWGGGRRCRTGWWQRSKTLSLVRRRCADKTAPRRSR